MVELHCSNFKIITAILRVSEYLGILQYFMNQTTAIPTIYEPQHDKTNKMDVRPAKTQISLGMRPV